MCASQLNWVFRYTVTQVPCSPSPWRSETNQETEKELMARCILRRLAYEGSRGSERTRLQKYMACINERLARWGELERKLEAWKEESTNFFV